MSTHVKYFERVFLSSLILGLVVTFLTFSTRAGIAGNDILLAALVVVECPLVLLISRKTSNTARWFLVALVVTGAPFYLSSLVVNFATVLIGALSSMQVIAQYVGLYFLFSGELNK